MGSLAPPLSATTESFGRHEVNGPTAGGKERGEGDGPGEGDGEGDCLKSRFVCECRVPRLHLGKLNDHHHVKIGEKTYLLDFNARGHRGVDVDGGRRCQESREVQDRRR